MGLEASADEMFTCSWSPAGRHAAHVRARGELDLAGEPLLVEALRAAGGHARLVMLMLEELTFMDVVGLRVLLEACSEARSAGRRLVLTGVRPQVQRVFELTETRHLVEALLVPSLERGAAPAGPSPMNPVNAQVLPARTMDVPDRWLWLQGTDDLVRRAWMPEPENARDLSGHPIWIYLDERGALNGWLDPASMLAVNQRHLPPAASPPSSGDPMTCQGACGTVWWAPAAAGLQAHDEHCLTCAGPLARG